MTPAPSAEDLRRELVRFARFLQQPAGQVLRALICESEHDPTVARKLRTSLIELRRQLDRMSLERGIARGDSRRAWHADDALDALDGAGRSTALS